MEAAVGDRLHVHGNVVGHPDAIIEHPRRKGKKGSAKG